VASYVISAAATQSGYRSVSSMRHCRYSQLACHSHYVAFGTLPLRCSFHDSTHEFVGSAALGARLSEQAWDLNFPNRCHISISCSQVTFVLDAALSVLFESPQLEHTDLCRRSLSPGCRVVGTLPIPSSVGCESPLT
jgi:hypothetical protein